MQIRGLMFYASKLAQLVVLNLITTTITKQPCIEKQLL